MIGLPSTALQKITMAGGNAVICETDILEWVTGHQIAGKIAEESFSCQ